MSVSDDMIRSYFERWQRLEEEKRTVSDDLKELFAEAKSNGLDGKALRTVFREQVGDKAAAQEFDAICDLYRASLNVPRARRAREASGSSNGRTPEFDSGNGGSNPSPETIDPETGEIIERTPHSERSHDAARPSASTGNAPGEIPATEFQAKASEDNGATGKATMRPADSMTGEAGRVDAGRTASATSERMDVTAGETTHEFHRHASPETGSAGDPSPTHGEKDLVEVGTGHNSAVLPQEPYTAQVSPSAVSSSTVEVTAEPAVAQPQFPAATADPFENDLCADDPTIARQDMQTEPARVGSGDLHSMKSENPLHTNPLPNPSPSSEASSSTLTTTAGDVPPLTSPATQFNNPRCLHPDACHLVHSRDCCHDCLLAWGAKPRDDQLREWRAAERAALESEAS